jgi:hypothetical protein
VAVVDLPGVIGALLSHPSCTDLVSVQLWGKPLVFVIGRWRRLGVVFPLEGFVFGAGHRQAGPVVGQGVFVKASVATMVGRSDVGDMALVVVVGSSPACPWVCLGLLVVVKSKLRWRGPGGVR